MTTSLSTEELEHARDLGAITFLSSYVHLMSRQLGIDDSDNTTINTMTLQMLEPVNLGIEAAWYALMGDEKGLQTTMERFQDAMKTLAEENLNEEGGV